MNARHYMWCLLLIGLLGFSFYLEKSSSVFPAASIDIRLSQSQILQRAEAWAHKLGYSETAPVKSTVFSYDDDAKTFLEYELGSDQANILMKDTVPIWYWSTRFCKPLKQEEFTSWISPDGRLRSFEHELENDRALPSISHDSAEKLAERFVHEDGQLPLDGYKLIEQASVTQPHRTDHNFTWEDTKNSYSGAKLRTHIYISGNKVTAFNHYLYVPEKWTRRFNKLRSYNDALADAATIFYVALNIGSFFIFIWAFASGLVRWRFSLIVAIVYAVFSALGAANDLPVSIHEYTTSMPFAGFELELLLNTLTSSLGTFVQIFVLTASAEALYRKFYPDKTALELIFSTAGLRTQESFNALFSGLTTFGAHLGWIVLFYLIGRKLHFFCPMEVQNAESLSSTFPFFSALHVGFFASINEEFLYRVIGLIAFQRLVKKFWLANLLQAAAWAFMHSNYPQEPPYARGLELTGVGFFYGAILKNFGILPCIFSHNLIDTFLGLEPLFVSSVAAMRASAFLALTPFAALILMAVWLRFTKGKFANQEDLSNRKLVGTMAPAKAVVQEFAPQGYHYTPLTLPIRITLAVLAVLFALIQFSYVVPVVGQDARLTVGREQAINKATDYLVQNGEHPEGHTAVASLVSGLDDTEMQYIFEKDPKRLKEISEGPERPLLWRVRFFKPLVQEEYLILLDSLGRPMSFGLTLPENAPGASLTQAQAQAKVQAYLNKEHAEVMPYKFDSAADQKRDERIDYTFEFMVPKYKVGEAEYKITSQCVGDQVSGYDHEWLLPDKWKFEKKRVHLRDLICQYLEIGLLFLFGIAVLWWARGVIKTQAIAWKPAIALGLAMACIAIVKDLNAMPTFFESYGTETPYISFFVNQTVKQLIAAISSFALNVGLAAFGLASLRLLLPNTTVAAIARTTFAPANAVEKRSTSNLWLDAILIGFSAGLGQRAVWLLLASIRAHISPSVSMAQLDGLCSLANLVNPSLSTTLDAVNSGVWAILIVAIIIGISSKYLRSYRNFIIFAIAVSLIFPSQQRYWQDYVVTASADLIFLIGALIFVTRLARENLIAYFLTGFIAVIAGSMRILSSHAAILYQDDLIFLAAVMLMPIAYGFYLKTNKPKPMPHRADS